MKKAILAAGAAVLAGALAACSHVQPSLGQYAIVTGHGALSNQQVQDVVSPGDSVNQGSGTTVWYLPAQARNYVTAQKNGDRDNPQAELTAPSKTSPGMSDYTWTYVVLMLNPKITSRQGNYAFARAFLAFCLKYGCASNTAQNDASNAQLTRSSDPGWENMLNEIMPHAIDNATRDAIVNYGPDLFINRGKWGQFGDDIQKNLEDQVARMDGTNLHYFCGPASTLDTCTPPLVTVNDVTPADPDVVTQYNKQVSAQYALQAAQARVDAAKKLYGPDAYYFMGMMDLVNACHAQGVTCNIYTGNPPATGGR